MLELVSGSGGREMAGSMLELVSGGRVTVLAVNGDAGGSGTMVRVAISDAPASGSNPI